MIKSITVRNNVLRDGNRFEFIRNSADRQSSRKIICNGGISDRHTNNRQMSDAVVLFLSRDDADLLTLKDTRKII